MYLYLSQRRENEVHGKGFEHERGEGLRTV